MPRLIVHGFTISFAPRTFRPALPAVLTTLAALVCCTLAHAQIIDSTYILAVDRRVQEIDAAKDHEIRAFENEELTASPFRSPLPRHRPHNPKAHHPTYRIFVSMGTA
ncbi:MAG: hypothetical protein WAT74_07675 [Flavobacteriales bacterium]